MTSVSYFSSLDNDIYNECFKLVFKSPRLHPKEKLYIWLVKSLDG